MALRHILLVEKGPNIGQKLVLDEGRAILGRSSGCDFPLDDRVCSREHCAIEDRSGVLWAIDLASKNGTRVNGLPIEERELRVGDRIWLGQTSLCYRNRSGEAKSSGEITVEHEAFHSDTLSLSLEDGFEQLEAIGESWERRAIAAVYRVGSLAQHAASIQDFFEAVLGHLVSRNVVGRGALALFDVETEGFSHQVVHPRKEALVLPARTFDSIRKNKEVVRLENREERDFVCAPVWVQGEVRGILYVDVPDSAREVDLLLQLMGILGNLVGGTVQNLQKVETLEREKTVLRTGLQAQYEMIGQSPAMKEVFRVIDRVAPIGSTILVRGESGTGKELVARAIHYRSPQASGPFVAVNAAALPYEIVESELFGHEKGAFTGAVQAKQGRFELADGGTFFLDEIGDLDIRVQAKLLRVLEDGSYQRVGGMEARRTTARLIAATNQDLEEGVRNGTFREDLYYRLRVIEISLPALRERSNDIGLLVEHFLSRYSEEMGKRNVGIAPEAMGLLIDYPWPGNVRELRSSIERALVLSNTGWIDRSHLEFLEARSGALEKEREEEILSLREFERQHVLQVLEHARGNKSKAARLLGIDRKTLYQKIRDVEVDDD